MLLYLVLAGSFPLPMRLLPAVTCCAMPWKATAVYLYLSCCFRPGQKAGTWPCRLGRTHRHCPSLLSGRTTGKLTSLKGMWPGASTWSSTQLLHQCSPQQQATAEQGATSSSANDAVHTCSSSKLDRWNMLALNEARALNIRAAHRWARGSLGGF